MNYWKLSKHTKTRDYNESKTVIKAHNSCSLPNSPLDFPYRILIPLNMVPIQFPCEKLQKLPKSSHTSICICFQILSLHTPQSVKSCRNNQPTVFISTLVRYKKWRLRHFIVKYPVCFFRGYSTYNQETVVNSLFNWHSYNYLVMFWRGNTWAHIRGS